MISIKQGEKLEIKQDYDYKLSNSITINGIEYFINDVVKYYWGDSIRIGKITGIADNFYIQLQSKSKGKDAHPHITVVSYGCIIEKTDIDLGELYSTYLKKRLVENYLLVDTITAFNMQYSLTNGMLINSEGKIFGVTNKSQ